MGALPSHIVKPYTRQSRWLLRHRLNSLLFFFLHTWPSLFFVPLFLRSSSLKRQGPCRVRICTQFSFLTQGVSTAAAIILKQLAYTFFSLSLSSAPYMVCYVVQAHGFDNLQLHFWTNICTGNAATATHSPTPKGLFPRWCRVHASSCPSHLTLKAQQTPSLRPAFSSSRK